MASRRNRPINLPAPYLKRIWLEPSRITDRAAYPFCLPLLRDDFELSFDRAITIIVGENGTGKSTLLEAIGALAGYDEAGGGKGYRPVDHSSAIDKSGSALANTFRGHWLPMDPDVLSELRGSFAQLQPELDDYVFVAEVEQWISAYERIRRRNRGDPEDCTAD